MRIAEERTDTVALQFFPSGKLAKWRLPDNSFSISAGCFFAFLPPVFGDADGETANENRLTPSSCHVRLTPPRGIWQFKARRNPNVWAVDDDGKNLEKCVKDAAHVLEKSILPWFRRFEDLQELERTLMEDEEQLDRSWGFGAKGSPLRRLLTGLVAAKLEHSDIARENLRQVVEREELSRLAGSDEPLRLARKVLADIGK